MDTKINLLLEEARANLTLYQNGQDVNALERYYSIMDTIKKLKDE